MIRPSLDSETIHDHTTQKLVSAKQDANKQMIAEALLDPDFYIPVTQNGHSCTLGGMTCLWISHQAMKRPIPCSHSLSISRCIHVETVRVISDYTDVFNFLLHFCVFHKCTASDDMYMSSPVANRSNIDQVATAEKNKDIY